MSRTCHQHQCLKKIACRYKIWLGCLALCRINKRHCRYCAPNPYGRYEPEDIIRL